MGPVSAVLDALRRARERREFDAIRRACGLDLDPATHLPDLGFLREVFVERAYAAWFPSGKDAAVLDVGAHAGFFTLFAARHAGPGSRIAAVEPHPEEFRRLVVNLAANGATSVKTVNAAVDARSGEALLRPGPGGTHTLHPGHHRRIGVAPAAPPLRVRALSLEDLMAAAGLEEVDFLKLACEGAEYGALYAADAAVLRRIRVVSLEFHDLGEPGCTGTALARHLESHGFRVRTLDFRPTRIDNDHGRLVATR